MASKLSLPGVGIITGAASGIGRATALAFAAGGCSGLALADLNAEGLSETEQLIQALPGAICQVETYTMDVTVPESVENVYTAVKAKFGRLDYSVQSHGIRMAQAKVGTSADMPIEAFDFQNNVIYRGTWLCHRHALRIMQDQPLDTEAYPSEGIDPLRAQRGSIVDVNAGQALNALAGMTTYSAAKSALLGLVRAEAMDFARKRIRVNSILPGIVDTPVTQVPGVKEFLEREFVNKSPMQRKAMPEEVADTILYLASNKASFVTGASWAIDGGVHAGSLGPEA